MSASEAAIAYQEDAHAAICNARNELGKIARAMAILDKILDDLARNNLDRADEVIAEASAMGRGVTEFSRFGAAAVGAARACVTATVVARAKRKSP